MFEDFKWYKYLKGHPTAWEGHIIMHDSQETERGFGVKKFFEELQQEHPDWEFDERKESHGLAIICKKS